MKKIIVLIITLSISVFNIFASNDPNILINGYLGSNIPAAIILEVNSTVIEENGGVVSIMDNYNFTTNRSSITLPVYVYIGYSAYSNTSNVIFNLEISTEGFKMKNTSGVLIGSPLDVDILMHTETLNSATSKILVGASVLDSYAKNIFLNTSSTPAPFSYSVQPGAAINDANFNIYFTWGEKLNTPAGEYGALINFAITAS